MKKKIFNRSIVGFFTGIAIGQIISVIISLISGNGEFIICAPEFVEYIGNEAIAGTVQTLLCAVMGMGFAASSVIWEMENINIAAQTGICLSIYSVIMFPIAYFTYWMEHSLLGIITYVCVFIFLFVVIWITQYIIYRKRLNEINKMIKQ